MTERPGTKSRILDSAEKLFAFSGFEATSLRDITAEAGVNLAAVNYHFQTKESLIDAVIARRIEPVNRKRLERLEAAGPNPGVEEILRAFISPLLEVPADSVVPLMGRILSNPDQFVDRVFNKHLSRIAATFSEAFSKALPELPRKDILWRLHFTVGVITHSMLWGHILPRITDGVCDISDRQALIETAVKFLAAGFKAPASKPALEKETPQ